MGSQLIEISTEGFHLRTEKHQLLLEKNGNLVKSLPIEDLGYVILDNPQITISQGCLRALLEENVGVISCSKNHHPIGLFLPLEANSLLGERVRAQAQMKEPIRKQLWKQIVQMKVRNQGSLIKKLYGNDSAIKSYEKLVRSGDPDNIEAQVARKYWGLLFRDKEFKRDADGEDQNRFLNYGYSLVRACMTRAICAAGLLPCLGLHHHNRYNSFPLSDDLMEPYRPYVDRHVYKMLKETWKFDDFSPALKRSLFSILNSEVVFNKEHIELQTAIQLTANSAKRAIVDNEDYLDYPIL